MYTETFLNFNWLRCSSDFWQGFVKIIEIAPFSFLFPNKTSTIFCSFSIFLNSLTAGNRKSDLDCSIKERNISESTGSKVLLTANSGSSEADQSDRSGRPVRPVCSVVFRVGFVLFWKFLYKPTWRVVRLPRPINTKAKADWGDSQSNQLKYRITFCLSNPSLFQP